MNKTPTVALLFEHSLAAGRDILMGVGQYMRENHAWTVYAQPHDLNQPLPKWFKNWEGDGIIAQLLTPKMFQAVRAKGVPVVNVQGEPGEGEGIPLVCNNFRAIGKMAAEHLFDRGFRDFGYLGVEQEYWSVQLQEGFSHFLATKGCVSNDFLLSRRSLDRMPWNRLVDRVAEWVGSLPAPVGIMLCSDYGGLMVQEACRIAKRVVGEDTALIGVGNDHVRCELCNPPLSSIEANNAAVGFEAAALLDRMMAGEQVSTEPVTVDPLFVGIRESTDFLAVDDPGVAKALHFIRYHCGEPLKLDTVARYAGVSRSVLQRRFRKLLDRTVYEEITAARLRKAMELLRRTDLPIDEIAEKSGFGYAPTMCRTFRKHLNQPPKHYRHR